MTSPTREPPWPPDCGMSSAACPAANNNIGAITVFLTPACRETFGSIVDRRFSQFKKRVFDDMTRTAVRQPSRPPETNSAAPRTIASAVSDDEDSSAFETSMPYLPSQVLDHAWRGITAIKVAISCSLTIVLNSHSITTSRASSVMLKHHRPRQSQACGVSWLGFLAAILSPTAILSALMRKALFVGPAAPG